MQVNESNEVSFAMVTIMAEVLRAPLCAETLNRHKNPKMASDNFCLLLGKVLLGFGLAVLD